MAYVSSSTTTQLCIRAPGEERLPRYVKSKPPRNPYFTSPAYTVAEQLQRKDRRQKAPSRDLLLLEGSVHTLCLAKGHGGSRLAWLCYERRDNLFGSRALFHGGGHALLDQGSNVCRAIMRHTVPRQQKHNHQQPGRREKDHSADEWSCMLASEYKSLARCARGICNPTTCQIVTVAQQKRRICIECRK